MLANGIQVTFYDLSRRIAADRWLVKIKCESVLKVQEEQFDAIDDSDLASAMKQDCSSTVIHTIFRERNFIDESEKDGILQELFSQLSENARTYMEQAGKVIQLIDQVSSSEAKTQEKGER